MLNESIGVITEPELRQDGENCKINVGRAKGILYVLPSAIGFHYLLSVTIGVGKHTF